MNQHLRLLRLAELDHALKLAAPWMIKPARILEIGAGCGHQAAELNRRGFSITAIDVNPCKPPDSCEYPVELFDGKHIPLPDNSVEIVFNSNTLEHILDIKEMLAELRRVLTPEGIAIHIVPSAAWRSWMTIIHYPALFILALKTLLFAPQSQPKPSSTGTDSGRKILHALCPHPHGEHGNLLTEHLLFRRKAWTRLFEQEKWTIVRYDHNHLFYTGHCLLSIHLPISLRTRIALLTGGACHIFILKP